MIMASVRDVRAACADPGVYDEVGPAPGKAEVVGEAALDELFSNPTAELVHVRAVEFGCFHAEVRRPS